MGVSPDTFGTDPYFMEQEIMDIQDAGSRKIIEYLGMNTRPVGIKLVRTGETLVGAKYDEITGAESFCWFVHNAARGKNYLIRREDLDCNKAEMVLGFREPRFANIEPRIHEKIMAVRIGPVDDADTVMLVLNPEQAMTLGNLMPGMNLTFKWNRTVCGEGMAYVYNSKKPSVNMLCIGARTDGEFKPDELLVTLPYKSFLELPSRMGKFASMSRQALDSLSEKLKIKKSKPPVSGGTE